MGPEPSSCPEHSVQVMLAITYQGDAMSLPSDALQLLFRFNNLKKDMHYINTLERYKVKDHHIK